MHFLSWAKNNFKNNRLLWVIVTVGALLRLISVYPGYYYPHGDELLFSQAVYMIINKTLSFQPQFFGFPPLIPWLMIPFFLTVFIPLFWLISLVKHFQEIYLFFLPLTGFFLLLSFLLRKKFKFLKFFLIAYWLFLAISGAVVISKGTLFHGEILGKNWINALYWGRYLTAFFGTWAIILTYKTVLVFFENKRMAILAALFTAVNYRLVLNSHVGLPDTFNVFFLLLAFLQIGKLLRNPNVGNYLKTWLSLALSVLVKYQVHIFIPFAIAHLMVSVKAAKGEFRKFLKVFFSGEVVFGGVVALFIVLIAHFYHFRNWERVLEINQYESLKYGFGRNIFNLYIVSYLYHVGLGAPLVWATIGGILVGLLRRNLRPASLVVLSALPTFGFLYLYYTGGGYYTRNLISIIPVFLIFAALFIDRTLVLVDRDGVSKPIKIFVFWGLTLFFILGTVKNSLIAAYGLSRPSPRQEVQTWLDNNIQGEVVFGRYREDPAPSDNKVIFKSLPVFSEGFSSRELSEEGFEKLEIELGWLRSNFLWWMRNAPALQIKFWNKPNDLLSQNYYALAFRELLWVYGKKIFISAWQAPTHQYAVFDLKSPFFFKDLKIIKTYDDFSSGWLALWYLKKDAVNLSTSQGPDGKIKLFFKKGRTLTGGIRWQSEPIVIKGDRGYQLLGEIEKLSDVKKAEREAFLRLDFYKEKPDVKITSRPFISFVSERVYGKKGLMSVRAEGVSPKEAKYAVIGFAGEQIAADYILSRVRLFETESEISDEGQHLTIEDDDLFFPNDDGIL